MTTKAYPVTILDSDGDEISGAIFSESDCMSDSINDEDVYFYGISRKEAIKNIGEPGCDFTIISVGDYLELVPLA